MRNQLNPTCSNCLAAVFVLLAIGGDSCYAQTPWQTAPALPAPLPTARPKVDTTKLTNLPPPPRVGAGQNLQSMPGAETLVDETLVIPLPSGGGPRNDFTAPPPAFGGRQNGNATNITFPPLPGSTNATAALRTSLPPLPSPLDIPLPSGLPPSATPSVVADATLPTNNPTSSLVSYTNRGDAGSQLVEFQPGELIAVVGTEHILAGDLSVFIDPIIEKNRDRIRDSQQEAEVRAQLTRQVLRSYVEVKALYLEFFRDMVGTTPPQELKTMKEQVLTKAGKIFFEKQVPELQERYKVDDLASLEMKLREKSLSLASLRTQFVEQILSAELERKYVPQEFEVDRDEILEAYHKDLEKWQVPARARWRQITIRFDLHDSRSEAEQLIKNLGNQMFLGGKPFEAVAKQSSEGFTASQGGVYDWTSQSSLKSKQLDAAIFTLEPNRLSRVIEDEVGFHIIEVLERESAHTTDLAESQAEIRKSLSKAKRDKAGDEFRAKIMKRTPIWTQWPEDIPGSRSLQSAIGK